MEHSGPERGVCARYAFQSTDFSEKGKPIVRWGHKVHGSSEAVGDGQAAGEKEEER